MAEGRVVEEWSANPAAFASWWPSGIGLGWMNPKMQNLAILIAVGFVILFVALIWLVRRMSTAGGWHDLGTPDRPIRIGPGMQSRLVGILTMIAGVAFILWSRNDANTARTFSIRMAVLGPAILGVGSWLTIEGPELPADRMSVLGWILVVAGLASGFLYMNYLKSGWLPFFS